MTSGLALVVAAVVGALLNSVGAYLNDYFTRRREERESERQHQQRQEEWDREDRVKKQEQEQQAVAAQQKAIAEQQERRVRAYKAFAAATAVERNGDPIGTEAQSVQLRALDETFIEVQMYASDFVSMAARTLSQKARPVINAGSGFGQQDEYQQLVAELSEARKSFWTEVRDEAEETMRMS